MINTKIALSAMSIVASLALLGGAAFAYFSDTATSTNNTFGASTMDLTLSNDASNFFNDVSATFNVSNLIPGDSAAQIITLKNNGSTPIAEIALGLTATNTDPNTDGSDLRDKLDLHFVDGGTSDGHTCSGGTDITTPIAALYGDNVFPLTMNELNGHTYDSLPIALTVGATDNLCIQATFDPTAGDIYQGDSANATFSFVAHQDTSQ